MKIRENQQFKKLVLNNLQNKQLSAKSLFITGTNTGIGKTTFAALLLRAARSAQIPAYYFKPIQTGDDSDCDTIKYLAGQAEQHIIRPIYSLSQAAAPYLAAQAENRTISLDPILKRWQQYQAYSVIVEGAGGLLVPIAKSILMRDLIQLLGLRVLIVAATTLGTINHTLLTIEATLAANIPIIGVVLSGKDNKAQAKITQEFTHIPILAEIPKLNLTNIEKFQHQASSLLKQDLLMKIFYDN